MLVAVASVMLVCTTKDAPKPMPLELIEAERLVRYASKEVVARFDPLFVKWSEPVAEGVQLSWQLDRRNGNIVSIFHRAEPPQNVIGMDVGKCEPLRTLF